MITSHPNTLSLFGRARHRKKFTSPLLTSLSLSVFQSVIMILPRVDFTNVYARIFRTRLSYERLFSSYVLRKMRAKNVGEIDP